MCRCAHGFACQGNRTFNCLRARYSHCMGITARAQELARECVRLRAQATDAEFARYFYGALRGTPRKFEWLGSSMDGLRRVRVLAVAHAGRTGEDVFLGDQRASDMLFECVRASTGSSSEPAPDPTPRRRAVLKRAPRRPA